MIDMKTLSFLSLGTALALGAAATLSVAPAYAAKKEKAPKAPEAPKVELSKEFRAAAGPVEADIKANKLDGMAARLDALTSQFKLPDEQFILGARRYEFGRATNNQAELRKAVITMIDSKSSLNNNAAQLNAAAGQYAYNAQDFPDALARLNEAVRLGNKEPDTFILMAEASFRSNNIPQGLGYAGQAVAAKKALGQRAPEDWFRRPLSLSIRAKLPTEIAKWSRELVGAYPSPQNWRDTLLTFKDGAKLDGQPALDVMRLIRSAKALAGERDYFEYAALATERGLPGEAKAVIDEGMASGAISKASRPLNELLAAATAKVAGDLSSLAASEKRASTDAAGKIAAGTADAYLGYGQDSKAVPLYRLALQKGQVDNDAVNTRLGIALARQGQVPEAKQAFAAVTGPRAEVAKYWMLWLESKAQPAPAN
jgi:hypothetical protein